MASQQLDASLHLPGDPADPKFAVVTSRSRPDSPRQAIWLSAGVDSTDDLESLQVDDADDVIARGGRVGTGTVRLHEIHPTPEPALICLSSLRVAASNTTTLPPDAEKICQELGVRS